MWPSANTDIVPLLKHLCLSLQPYATSRSIELVFIKSKSAISFDHQPCNVIHSLSQLLCRIISYLPAGGKIEVSTAVVNTTASSVCEVAVHNTGINLSKIREITNELKPAVTVQAAKTKETRFTLQIPIPQTAEEKAVSKQAINNDENLPVFFEDVRKRLQRYFSRTNHLENLAEINPRKAVFLKKINECILNNLHNENFDATALAKVMAMSRAQLLRKLKPIISQPPASYIKNIRLHKAKELLQTSELSVSEVSYKTGFKNPSHFTKVFTDKFGIRPSAITTSRRLVQINK